MNIVNTQHYTKWHLPHGAKIRLGKAGVYDIRYSPDGSQLAIHSLIGIWLYDANSYEEIALLKPNQDPSTVQLPYAWTGTTLYLIERVDPLSLTLWDTRFGQKRITLKEYSGDFREIFLSPDGRTLATGDWDGTISFWDSQTGLLTSKVIGHTAPVGTIVFSPDSQILASAGHDNKIHIWNVNDCEKISTIKERNK